MTIYLDGVGHQVTSHVIDFVTAVIPPVLVTNGTQIPHGLLAIRLLIHLLHLAGVLLPTVQPEPVNLHGSSTQVYWSEQVPELYMVL